MEKHTFKISGMGGQHCVMVIKNIIAQQEGATLVDIAVGSAAVNIDETKTSAQALAAAIEKMGYQVVEQAMNN